MNPGNFDQRIVLQRRLETRSPRGESIVTYVDAFAVWAAVEPLSGRELFHAQQTQSEVTTRIRIHWRSGVTQLMRVLHVTTYGSPDISDLYDIKSVIDVRAKHHEMHLMCVRRASEQPLQARPTITADMDSITADNG